MKERLDQLIKAAEKKFLHIQVGEHVYDKIHNHVRKLKYLQDQNLTKRAWLHEAIRDKLNREKKVTDLPKKKYLSIAIDPELNMELEKRIALIRRFMPVSKKGWVLEAILEKLESDQATVKGLSDDLEQVSRPID